MFADACHLSVRQHDDLVGVLDGAHALRDDEHRTPVRLCGERMPQRGVGLEIERRETVIEHHQLGVSGQCARNRQTLLLPTGEVRTALRDAGFQSLRQRIDELAGLRDIDRMIQPLIGGISVSVRRLSAIVPENNHACCCT